MAKKAIFMERHISVILYCDLFKRERRSRYIRATLCEVRLPSDKLGRMTRQRWSTGELHNFFFQYTDVSSKGMPSWGQILCELPIKKPNSIFTLSFKNETLA